MMKTNGQLLLKLFSIPGKKTCEVATHFSGSPHTLQDFEFIIIEQISSIQIIEIKFLNRESYWTSQLRS